MIEAAEECADRGIETYFVTVNPKRFISGGSRPKMKDLLSNSKIKVVACKKNKAFELGTVRNRQLDYAREVFKNVPKGTAIILSDDESIWGAGKLLAGFYPVVGVLHSDEDAYYDLYNRYHQYFAAITAVSNRVKNKISNNDKVSTIPCGIRLPNFKPNSLHDRPKDNPILFWAGRIEERQKRVSDLAKIASALTAKNMDFKWVIAGHGDEAALKQLIQKYELRDKFEFTGWLDQSAIYKCMQGADMLVLPSNFEGMPVVVMEALSMGLGIVSSRVSGVEDLEHDKLAENTLRIFEIGDTQDAADKIMELWDRDPQSRHANAKSLASKYFSIETCMDKYDDVISNLTFSPQKSNHTIRLGSILTHSMMSWGLFLLRFLKFKLQRRS